jgi:hypothetical protein
LGRLANSKWRLNLWNLNPTQNQIRFCALASFYPDNAVEELYYLEMNYDKNTVNYQHKNNPDYDGKAILRTSFETTKKIKQIEIYNLTSWAKYYEYDDLDVLRKEI